jgi:hypothetical protein
MRDARADDESLTIRKIWAERRKDGNGLTGHFRNHPGGIHQGGRLRRWLKAECTLFALLGLIPVASESRFPFKLKTGFELQARSIGRTRGLQRFRFCSLQNARCRVAISSRNCHLHDPNDVNK